MALARLPRNFYLRPTLTVARDLLGKYLCRRAGRGILVGRIVEVEAYLGSRDPASHTFRGKTTRNEVMFREGGHLYVYFTYGMHFCANVVTEGAGTGVAVLLRAVEPITGMETMLRNRSGGNQRKRPQKAPTDLCGGPARLCQAFGITRSENGSDLCGKEIWIAEGLSAHDPVDVGRSTRVGIRNGTDRPWRFFIKGNPFVSPGRPVHPTR
jgi:DNA-3-methyladenine glycosylase